MFLGKFCLAVFSYFPLVNFFEKTLLKIIEEVKIKRMEVYANSPEDLYSIDARYLAREAELLSYKLLNNINSIPPQLDAKGIIYFAH